MPIKRPGKRKLKVEVQSIKGQGVDIQATLNRLQVMQCELEALGCKVTIQVEGVELKAGNETRTRDILLGNFSVIPTGETANVFGSTEENDYNQKQCYVEHGRRWEFIDSFTNDGWCTTAYWCPVCGKFRHAIVAVLK